ncbi:hypothetical protein AB5J62_39335 [Amycolatopsis sp. cg5]|uniref:hypothetical protein n=1 Tax=Amycolatopsis sp. cg5 TaxID=3238802 RepID=UPI0035236523
MSVRDDARRLLEAVPEDRVQLARELLQTLVDESEDTRPRRVFSSMGIGHATSDLGTRAKEIARHELGDGEARTA